MWNGGKEAETENFPRGRGGGRLFRWRVYFSWLVLEFGVKVPRPIVITLTLVIGGKAFCFQPSQTIWKNSRFSLPDLPGIEWTLLISRLQDQQTISVTSHQRMNTLQIISRKWGNSIYYTCTKGMEVVDLPNERFIWQFFSDASHCIFKQNRLKEKEFGKC